MNLSSIAARVRCIVAILSRDDRADNESGTPRLHIGPAAALVTLLLALPVSGRETTFSSEYYSGGLTAESSWAAILKAPGIQPQWPELSFGNTLAPISIVCLDSAEDKLRIADPGRDNGVRMSAEPFRETARAAMTGSSPARLLDRDAALTPSIQRQPAEPPEGAISFPVSVYKSLPNNKEPVIVFLFHKPWEVPICSAR